MEDYSQQIEDSRDLRREWINMVTNKGFKREFNGHQIRVINESEQNIFKMIFRKTENPYIFLFIMQSLSFSNFFPSKN